MPALVDVMNHRRALDDYSSLAIGDVVDLARQFDLDVPPVAQRQAQRTLTAVLEPYSDAVATSAADWYEDLRFDSVGGRYTATLADPPTEGQIRSMAGWSVEPIWAPDRFPGEDPFDLMLSRLSGGAMRLLFAVDRATILDNAERDPLDVAYARYASANACAFCSMLATRGAVYTSKEKARKGHDYCRCMAVPEFPDDEFERPDYYTRFQDAYDTAWSAVGSSDPKAIAAEMRRILGTH